jgi:hypothetical protein
VEREKETETETQRETDREKQRDTETLFLLQKIIVRDQKKFSVLEISQEKLKTERHYNSFFKKYLSLN